MRLSLDDTRAAYQALRNISDKAGEKASVETAALMLDSEKESFERTYAGSENIEAKATTMLGVVAGASGAFGLFGVAKAGAAVVATPMLFTAFTFVLVSFAALLYMLRAKTMIAPNLHKYLTPATVREDNRIGLSLSLAMRYNEMRDELRREMAAEPHALFVAYASIATAAMLVVLNTTVPSGGSHLNSGPRHTMVLKKTRPVQSAAARGGNHRRLSPGPNRTGSP
ncbi:MAG TPA: hypothetical protein VGX96_16010 [Candidatus Elarobacter sp.]|nr:hypothetical protein [Candidatus Elarobacter sp.]